MRDEKFMAEALKEAKKAYKRGDNPIGAVAVFGGKIIARGGDRKESRKDPTAHAEMECLRKAAKRVGDWRLTKVKIYSTLEPCYMCAGAMLNARIEKLIYGAQSPLSGGSKILKDCVVKGVLESECRKILKSFFRMLRARRK